MYYTNEFVDTLVQNIKIPGAELYVAHSPQCIAQVLEKNKIMYKMFGVYWWALKDALRKYINTDEWYCQRADDPLMKERAFHGDLFRTVLAAAYYQSEQIELRSSHTWYDANGNQHEYTLFDENAEC